MNRVPPCLYLLEIAERCPKAMLSYLLIWKTMDANCYAKFNKATMRDDLLMSPTRFKNDLYELVKTGLVSFEDKVDYFLVEAVDYDSEAEEIEEFAC